MTMFSICLLVLCCVLAIFGAYWLLSTLSTPIWEWWLQREGRIIDWNDSLAKVKGGGGFFVVVSSHDKIFFVAGEMPRKTDLILIERNYKERGNLVRSGRCPVKVADVLLSLLEERCVELDINMRLDSAQHVFASPIDYRSNYNDQ